MKAHILKVVATAMLWMLCHVAHAGTHHYYYTDPQGTVLAKADASGTIVATYDYAPYGTAVASMSPAPNGPGYTGHVNDPDTGLVYMQARYYDPAVGRFLSVDPVMPTAGSGFKFNRYNYGNNNPIGNTDPTGKDDCGYRCMERRAQSDSFIFGGSGEDGGGSSNSQNGEISKPAPPHAPGCDGSAECDEVKGAGYKMMQDQAEAEKKAAIFGVKFIAINTFTEGLGKLFGRVVEFLPFKGISSEAKAIASGHAFSKHGGEFADIGINTEEQFARHIERVMTNPTATRDLERGRVAYWDAQSGTVVIHDPNSLDGGTAFIPTRGLDYFNGLK
ncbi:RHS repeat-associated core domain-containing protein [Rhodanobacter sp. OK091]|uniref:RHS repeat domain-containing protein n=1 Tax=Rhodanobacter sp. OK091 TaxID=1881037 RepID=UPI00091F4507|nr:RHS repeat-associated core domain-containing protein [Rhodanobacter sp. OK091]SHM26796.1 RHS repeat-associated core domain-containing protein [Rhodanobacter sp. OK091]